jgi:hypothetical protein
MDENEIICQIKRIAVWTEKINASNEPKKNKFKL